MRKIPPLEQLRRLLRVRVCGDCPYRTPGTDGQAPEVTRPCEEGCPLFVHLPLLREAARQVDPMVGNRPRMVRQVLSRIAGASQHGAKTVRRHGRRVAVAIDELFFD